MATQDGLAKRLIVTADDFGAAREVNEAVELAHVKGILTTASLMMSGAAVGDAVARARKLPRLRVGLHLVLVDGLPVLAADHVPDLVDSDGRFPRDVARAGRTIFLRPSARRQVAAEIAAQFYAFRATGLALDHVNAHHHFHLHPTVASLVLEIGARHGLRAIRVPSEPEAILRQIDPACRARDDWRARPWRRLLRHRVQRRGLMTPAHVFGLAWSGAMTEARIAGVLRHLPGGVSEIYTHPATSDRFDGAVGRHAEELAALVAPGIVALVAEEHLPTGGYSDFLR